VLWIGVLIAGVGSAVAGLGVTALHWGSRTDMWLLVAAGSALTAFGIALLLANNVMSNVH
jgi:hypothetical protein